jgi:hypothetical protein
MRHARISEFHMPAFRDVTLGLRDLNLLRKWFVAFTCDDRGLEITTRLDVNQHCCRIEGVHVAGTFGLWILFPSACVSLFICIVFYCVVMCRVELRRRQLGAPNYSAL